MLSPNNPDLDPDLLSEKLKVVAANRRRDQPLFIKPKAVEFVPGVGYTYQTTGIRAVIKRIPLLGPVAVAANRKLRQIRSPGLTWKQRVMLVPVVGPAIHLAYAILRLNRIRHEIAVQMIELRQAQQASHAQTNQRIDQILSLDIENRLRRYDALDIGTRLNRLEPRADAIEESLRAVFAADAARENALAGLRQELRRYIQSVPSTAPQGPATAAPVTNPGFDADTFYTEFERHFRGSRDAIRDRLKVYLPYLAHFKGENAARIVDVGCGRGEWLELLGAEGFKATGVDMNQAMVADCKERGLDAECGDAIAYLRRQPEGSLAAVTGFHIIEHLPFETLVALFDAALHAVRKDGLIIFETPNPENLMVGACNFYTDPTHLHPVVPAVAEFMARQRGFAKAEILRLNPYPPNIHLIEENEVSRRVNQALYGPQDYAVIAWKTYAN
ncbi:class I SAM-dependent methyltransferase [Noviherbaspirillum denitrificans]|uniref:Methyltransferase type 11 domain-containing protein n=1 Tax=Noviherbaspirillum denitrificans TaxID=1968433 RepID=A0A254TGD1_9BURK|nr:class I SAM-dependent methyltransferase [Noviherbaspirillum denitrificans]OWW21690.1 hypothetical protein AYR66_21565 [Noviherbaspirillum denitrificans]